VLARIELATLGLPVLLGVFWLLDRWARRRRKVQWGPDRRVNLVYWFLQFVGVDPVVDWAQHVFFGAMLATSAGVVRGVTAPWVGRQPAVLQGIVLVLTADLLLYWWHRFMHTRVAWRYHAVHHSTVELDWLGAVRHHPLEGLAGSLITGVPLVLLGFSSGVVAGWWIPLSIFLDWLSHANLGWDFGPFRYVLASPAYHRWHHATDAEAIDKNFAQVFPIWDVLFGTCYLPSDGRQPKGYGLVANDVPATLGGQLLHPFVRRDRHQVTGR
jgi:sterol desaturase/sphingolipid hydroxylase (fatty acid hydroxylase superfamily)